MGFNMHRPDIQVSAQLIAAGPPFQYGCTVGSVLIDVDAVGAHRLLDSLVITATSLVMRLPGYSEDRLVGDFHNLNAIVPQLNIIAGIIEADRVTRGIPDIGMPVLFDIHTREREHELVSRISTLFAAYLRWYNRYRAEEHEKHGPNWGNNFDGQVEAMCEYVAQWVKEIRET